MKQIMNRCLALLCLIVLVGVSGCDVPSPPQYDRAMLREYQGATTAEVKEAFGNPPQVTAVTPEETQEDTPPVVMQWTYSTVDGDLVFHFNDDDGVQRITYLGTEISPSP
ncbi:MAG: hypothetical protein WD534_18145 [Phycisphaeraceae bacterium]